MQSYRFIFSHWLKRTQSPVPIGYSLLPLSAKALPNSPRTYTQAWAHTHLKLTNHVHICICIFERELMDCAALWQRFSSAYLYTNATTMRSLFTRNFLAEVFNFECVCVSLWVFSVYVCMCVCVCMYVCECVCVCVCVCMWIYLSTDICARVYGLSEQNGVKRVDIFLG